MDNEKQAMDRPTGDLPQKKERTQTLDRLMIDSPLVRIAAVLGSVGFTLHTAVSNIHREFYDYHKKFDPVASWNQERLSGLAEIGRDVEKGAITATEHFTLQRAIEEKFTTHFNDYVKKKGIPIGGWEGFFEGTRKKLAEIGPGNRRDVVFRTGEALIFTLGAYMAVQQISHFRHAMEKQDDKLDTLMRQVNAKADQQHSSIDK